MSGQENRDKKSIAHLHADVETPENAFCEMMNFMPFAYHSLDQQACILRVNDKWLEMLGYQREEVIGHWLGEFICPEYLEYFKETFPRFKERGYSDNVEMLLCHKDGHVLYIALSGRIQRDAEGRFVSTNCIFHNVTRYKETQKQLKQLAEHVSAKNREIQNFASIVSHDLRAPLVNIKGFTNELKHALALVRQHAIVMKGHLAVEDCKKVEEALDIDIPEAMDFIESSVTRMDRQIHALLTLSRMQRQQLDVVPVETTDIIHSCLEMLAHQIQDQGISIEVSDVPPVRADLMALEKIFANLLDNAVKYLNPAQPGSIQIGGRREGDYTLFWVRDNGCGIEAKNHEMIFDVFQRVGEKFADGEGMGLAYIRTLVERHDGKIWCESALNEGAVFYFTIAHDIVDLQ